MSRATPLVYLIVSNTWINNPHVYAHKNEIAMFPDAGRLSRVAVFVTWCVPVPRERPDQRHDQLQYSDRSRRATGFIRV